MAYSVRNQVFESNSSSSHSVSISEDDMLDFGFDQATLRSGLISITPDASYAWGWKRFYTPKGKLGYLLVSSAEEWLKAEPGNDLMPQLLGNERVQRLVKAVRKLTKCDIELLYPEDAGSFGVYAERRSSTFGLDEIINDQSVLNHLLFSSKSYIETGNDESQPPMRIQTDLESGAELYDPAIIETSPPEGANRWFNLRWEGSEKLHYTDDEGYEHDPKVLPWHIEMIFGGKRAKAYARAVSCEMDIKDYRPWDYERRVANEPDYLPGRIVGRKRFCENLLFELIARMKMGKTGVTHRRIVIDPEIDVKATLLTEITHRPLDGITDMDRFEVRFVTDDATLEKVRAEMINAYTRWNNVDTE